MSKIGFAFVCRFIFLSIAIICSSCGGGSSSPSDQQSAAQPGASPQIVKGEVSIRSASSNVKQGDTIAININVPNPLDFKDFRLYAADIPLNDPSPPSATTISYKLPSRVNRCKIKVTIAGLKTNGDLSVSESTIINVALNSSDILSVAADPNEISISKSSKYGVKLGVWADFSDGTRRDISDCQELGLKSLNESVARIDSAGILRPVSTGTTNVTGIVNGISINIPVTVD